MRGLVWRSHPDQEGYAEQENAHLEMLVNQAGGEVLADERVRRAPEEFYEMLAAEAVTVLNQTPTAFYQLARVAEESRGRAELRKILVYSQCEELSTASVS